MGKPEGKIEGYLRRRSESMGYLCWKFTSPSKNGVPDRMLLGHGQTFFVETKAPGEQAHAQQLRVHDEMRDHGATVFVGDTEEAIEALLRKMVPRRFWREPDEEDDVSSVPRAVGTVRTRQGLASD